MTLRTFQLILLISFLASHVFAHKYCSILCGKLCHTVCLNQPCRFKHDHCGERARTAPLSQEERKFVMGFHNERRQKVASGGDTRNGVEAAANMMALSYDLELEFIAQCYANTCPSINDECRDIARTKVGQNFYAVSGKPIKNETQYLERAMNYWYEQISRFDSKLIDHFNQTQGGFSQFIWAKTTLVGCGRVLASYKSVVVICNYAESGNVVGAKIFEKGKGCTACGKVNCSSKYNALCGNDRMITRFQPPYSILKSIHSIGLTNKFKTPLFVTLIITYLMCNVVLNSFTFLI